MSNRIRLSLEYFHPWTNDAPYHVAAARGWYAEAGIEVRQVLLDPLHGDSLHDLAAGEADLAVFPTNRLFVRREAGDPLVGVAAVNHRAMETLLTLRSSGIGRPADLAGRRLALNPTPRGLALTRHLVEADGGEWAAVRIVDSGSREVNADDLADGLADAFFGAYWAWDALFGSTPEDQRLLWPVDEIGAPRYHSYLIGTTESYLAEHGPEVAAFLAATERGARAALTDVPGTLDVLRRTIPYVQPDFLERSLRLVAPTWFDHDQAWGVQHADVHAEYAAWLADAGILRDADVWRAATTDAYARPRAR